MKSNYKENFHLYSFVNLRVEILHIMFICRIVLLIKENIVYVFFLKTFFWHLKA